MKAKERNLVFVNFKDSNFIHAVITPEYYEIMIKENHRSPPGIYEDAEYNTYSVPFTFTTLNEMLPFCITEIGGFKLSAKCKNKRDLALVSFHQSCLAAYHKYHLDPKVLWFDYMETDTECAKEFKDIYERFKEMCVSPA